MTPKEQCEVLLDKLLPFAVDQIKKYREFYPFAAVILMDDSVELTGSYDGNEHPESKDVLCDAKTEKRVILPFAGGRNNALGNIHDFTGIIFKLMSVHNKRKRLSCLHK